MELAKLIIEPQSPSVLQPIEVLFNPNSYSIVKPVTWAPLRASGTGSGGVASTAQTETTRQLNAPPLVYGGGGSRVLTLQLFFDVTEPIKGVPIIDVRTETGKIVALTRIERDQQQPPICQITWGSASPQNSDFPFLGVVTNLTQSFVMFRASGEPVRANLTVVFTEYVEPEQDKRQTDPDLTTYVVKRGDTLSAIAAKLYRNPTLWRLIAIANNIDDPRRLTIGSRLSIPKVN